MKFLCPSCDRLTLLRDFRLDGRALQIRCDGCGAESRVEPSASSPPAPELPRTVGPGQVEPGPALHAVPRPPDAGDHLRAPEGYCPKCVARRREQDLSCPQCGLVFSNFSSSNFLLSPDVERLWMQATQRPEDEALQRRLLDSASVTGELPLLARLYRIRLAQNPADRAAQLGQAAILRLATAGSVLVSQAPSSDEVDRRKNFVMMTGLIVILVLLSMLGPPLIRLLHR